MSYAYTSSDGLARSNDASLVEAWNRIGAEQARAEREWVADLRSQGVKAAHPDDGWVDRVANIAQLAYPRFNDGLGIGDRLALGRPERYRIVNVIDVRWTKISGSIQYWFEP